jgi:transposase
LQALVLELREHVAELEQQLAWFTEQYRLGQHRRFAASSERCPEQLDLFADLLPEVIPPEPDAEPAAVSGAPSDDGDDKKPKRCRGGRGPLPSHLPREQVVHDLADSDKLCPCCGKPRVVIGEEHSEQLDIVAPKLKVIEHVRLKYACADEACGGVQTAAKPPQPIPKSLASPGLLAYLVIAKLMDGLPLYRQSKMFKRLGIDLSRQTMASWLIKAGELAWPLVNLVHDELLSCLIVQADETTLQVLNEPGRAAQTKSYLWGYRSGCGPPILLFEYQYSRGGSHPKAYLEGFLGLYLQTDGYSGYAQVLRDAAFEAVACWTHYLATDFIWSPSSVFFDCAEKNSKLNLDKINRAKAKPGKPTVLVSAPKASGELARYPSAARRLRVLPVGCLDS